MAPLHSTTAVGQNGSTGGSHRESCMVRWRRGKCPSAGPQNPSALAHAV